MEKLKKSLENNIWKTILKKNSLLFNIETGSNKNIENFPLTFISKTLTTNSCRQVKSLFNLEAYDLKYPIILKVFENNHNLNKYFALLLETNCEGNVVITKASNKIFKNNSYSIVKNVNSRQILFNFKMLLETQINLFRILKLKSTKT